MEARSMTLPRRDAAPRRCEEPQASDTWAPRFVVDIMTAPAVCVDVADRLDVVQAVMAHAKVRHVLVVSGGRLRGVISHRDVVSASRSVGDPKERAAHDHAITARSI